MYKVIFRDSALVEMPYMRGSGLVFIGFSVILYLLGISLCFS